MEWNESFHNFLINENYQSDRNKKNSFYSNATIKHILFYLIFQCNNQTFFFSFNENETFYSLFNSYNPSEATLSYSKILALSAGTQTQTQRSFQQSKNFPKVDFAQILFKIQQNNFQF